MFITIPKVFASMGLGTPDWYSVFCIGALCSADKFYCVDRKCSIDISG